MARTADTTHGGGPSLPRLDSQGRFETALPLVLAASPNPWDRYHVFLEGPATSSLVSPAPALGRVGLGMGGRREGVVRNLLLAMPRGQGLPKVRSMFLVSPYNAGPMQCLLILMFTSGGSALPRGSTAIVTIEVAPSSPDQARLSRGLAPGGVWWSWPPWSARFARASLPWVPWSPGPLSGVPWSLFSPGPCFASRSGASSVVPGCSPSWSPPAGAWPGLPLRLAPWWCGGAGRPVLRAAPVPLPPRFPGRSLGLSSGVPWSLFLGVAGRSRELRGVVFRHALAASQSGGGLLRRGNVYASPWSAVLRFSLGASRGSSRRSVCTVPGKRAARTGRCNGAPLGASLISVAHRLKPHCEARVPQC